MLAGGRYRNEGCAAGSEGKHRVDGALLLDLVLLRNAAVILGSDGEGNRLKTTKCKHVMTRSISHASSA